MLLDVQSVGKALFAFLSLKEKYRKERRKEKQTKPPSTT